MELQISLMFCIVVAFLIVDSCLPGQWQCSDDTCINESARCDNAPDCSNDELVCQQTTGCAEGQLSCRRRDGTSTCNSTDLCDCGPVDNITNGKGQLNEANNTRAGATASVSCIPGYRTTTPNISCEIDGLWQNATCDSVGIGPVTVPKTDYTLLIIILVCCAAFVWIVQLTSVACLVRKEHSQHLKTTGKGKALIALGCFPVLGIPILICISCSLKNRKYYVEQDYGSWAASTNTPYTIQTVNRSYPSFSSLYEETEIELPKEYTSANVHNNITNLNNYSTSHNNSDVNTNTSNNMNNIQCTHKKKHHKKELKYRERASKHPDEHKIQSKGKLDPVLFNFKGFDNGPCGRI